MLRALVIAAALAGAACRDARLTELQALRDEVCACKTVACGEAVMARVPKPGEGEPRSDHRMQQAARAMMDCLSQLYLKDRPSTDPDAEAPGSDEAGGGSAEAGGAAEASGDGNATSGGAGAAEATPPAAP